MRASRARRAGDVNQFVGAGRSEVPGPCLGQSRTCVHAYGASQDGHKRPIEPTGCPPKEPLPGVPGGPRERTMTTTPPRSSARAFALGSVATPSPAAALAPARPQAALGPTPWRKQLEVPARPRADTTPCRGPCGTTLVRQPACAGQVSAWSCGWTGAGEDAPGARRRRMSVRPEGRGVRHDVGATGRGRQRRRLGVVRVAAMGSEGKRSAQALSLIHI